MLLGCQATNKPNKLTGLSCTDLPYIINHCKSSGYFMQLSNIILARMRTHTHTHTHTKLSCNPLRERERERETEIETDKQTDRQRERQRERDRETETEMETDRQTEKILENKSPTVCKNHITFVHTPFSLQILLSSEKLDHAPEDWRPPRKGHPAHF